MGKINTKMTPDTQCALSPASSQRVSTTALAMSERGHIHHPKAGGAEGPVVPVGPSSLACLGLAPCVACVRLQLVIYHCTDCLTITSRRIGARHRTYARA